MPAINISDQQLELLMDVIACDDNDLSSHIAARSGKFTPPCHAKCIYYAKFMSGLTRIQADALFWCLFITVLLLLGLSATMYATSFKTPDKPDTESDLSLEEHQKLQSHRRKRCLYVSMCCSALSIFLVVMEAFAGMSIAFCDGEDLMFFYWGFWSLLQIGSVIAMWGIVVNEYSLLKGHERPPWGVALGTPVLVFAAMHHLINQAMINKVKEKKEAKSTATSLRDIESRAAVRSERQSSSDASLRDALNEQEKTSRKP